MKFKILITILAFISASALHAQNLKIIRARTDASGISGDKESRIAVKNISSAALSIRVIRTVANLAADHTTNFCWDVCFGPSTTTSGLVTIQAGATDSTHFHGYLMVGNNPTGASTVVYEFVNDKNSTDSVMLTFNYNGVTGINDVATIDLPALQAPYPSPASNYAVIKYNVPAGKHGVLNIYNALGALSYKTTLDDRQNEYAIPTLLLSDGLYFCTLQVDGKPTATKKLVVDHRN